MIAGKRVGMVELIIVFTSLLFVVSAALWDISPAVTFRDRDLEETALSKQSRNSGFKPKKIKFSAAESAPIFHILRQPKFEIIEPKQVQPLPTPVATLNEVRLLGIVAVDDQPDFVFLQVAGEIKPMKASKGDEVRGWQVRDLYIDNVVFARGEQVIKKTINAEGN
jgi:hypothetical protein